MLGAAPNIEAYCYESVSAAAAAAVLIGLMPNPTHCDLKIPFRWEAACSGTSNRLPSGPPAHTHTTHMLAHPAFGIHRASRRRAPAPMLPPSFALHHLTTPCRVAADIDLTPDTVSRQAAAMRQ